MPRLKIDTRILGSNGTQVSEVLFLKEVLSINVYTFKCDHVSSFHRVKTFDNIFDGGR